LKENGAKLIDETPRIGAEGCLIAFVHPQSTNGVLLELTQKIKI
jgi:methylmalonyl-CoA/ethylmalonyl-CoA epimerase